MTQAAIDCAEKYSREKHRCHSQLEAEYIDVADQVADADNGKKQQQWILCQQVNHDKSFFRFCSNSSITPEPRQGIPKAWQFQDETTPTSAAIGAGEGQTLMQKSAAETDGESFAFDYVKLDRYSTCSSSRAIRSSLVTEISFRASVILTGFRTGSKPGMNCSLRPAPANTGRH